MFGNFGEILNRIGPLLSSLVGALVTMANAAAPGITALLSALGPAIEGIAGPLGNLGALLGQALAGVLPVLSQLISALATGLAPILAPLGQVLQVVGTALTGVVNAVAPAIGPLAGAISSLISALAPILPLFAEVVSMVVQALAPALTTLFDAFAPVIKQLVSALQPVMQSLAPVLTQVASIIGDALAQVLQTLAPILGPIVTAFGGLLQAVVPILPALAQLITSLLPPLTSLIVALAPVITDLINVFAWLVNNVLMPLVLPVLNQLTNLIRGDLGPVFQWLWSGVVKPVWDAISGAIQWAWDNVIHPVWDAMVANLDALGKFFSWVWNNVIKPAWDGLGAGIKWVSDNVIHPVFEAIKSGLNTLHGVFDNIVTGIGVIWDKLKNIVSTPINFVIDTVLNNGLFKAWNDVVGFLHLPDNLKAPHLNPIKLATGGFVSGPGGPKDDKIPAMLSNGEYVLNAATVGRIGIENLNRINGGGSADGMASIAGLPALAAGGAVEAAMVNAHEFASSMSGQAYLMGGSAPGPVDCSGFMSAIADVVLGGSGHGRWWSTTAFPAGQTGSVNAGGQHWVSGLGEGFSIGVLGGAGSGGANGHTAGTLTGYGKYSTVNVESGGAHGDVMYGGSAAGADSSQFPTQWHLPIVDGLFEAAKPGSGGGHGRIWNWVIDHTFKPALETISKLIPSGEGLAAIPKAMYDRVSEAMLNHLKGGAASDTPGTPGTGPVQSQVQQAFARYGWGDGAEWAAASWIIDHESGWNPTARNPQSGAFGLAQFLGSTKDAYLPDENPNPGVQGDAMARYIRDRYNTPSAAKAFWESHNWYDQGGVFPNNSIGINQSGLPEAVLTNAQWKLFTRFVELLGQGKIGEAFASMQNREPAVVAPVVVNGGNGSNPDTSTPSNSQPTAQDFQSRAMDAGNSFLQANVDQFSSDIGFRSSGGAVQELVKQISASMQAQITEQMKQTRNQSAAFIGRR